MMASECNILPMKFGASEWVRQICIAASHDSLHRQRMLQVERVLVPSPM